MILEIVEFVVTLILGVVLGIVGEELLKKPIKNSVLLLRRGHARLTKGRDPAPRGPGQLYFANWSTTWISLEGTGKKPLCSDYLNANLSEEPISLPADLESIREEKRIELAKKAERARSDRWNAKRFALVGFTRTRNGPKEEPGLTFDFKLTDYAAFAGITRQADVVGLVRDMANNPTTIREKYLGEFETERPNRYLTHSFGINLLTISSDRKVVLVERNRYVEQKPNYYNISVNEGMQYPDDIDEHGQPSFLKTAVRGLWEEMGIDLSVLNLTTESIEFLNFGALAHANEYALLGQIRLPIKAQEVADLHYSRARDGRLEVSGDLYLVDFLPEAILDFVGAHGPWTDSGLACLYYAMVNKWGYHVVQSEFRKHPLRSRTRHPFG